MDLLGALSPTAQQTGQNKTLSEQQLKQQQDLATLLQKEGQTPGKFTSPWQVAGQWAQALAGKYKQSQLNQQYPQTNATESGGAVPGSPAPAQPGAAPAIPGQSPATPGAAPNNLPWSGNTSDAGDQMPDMSSILTG